MILSERNNPDTPGIFLAPGIMGLDQPPEEQFRSVLAAGDGSLLQGRRSATREIMLPIWVVGATLHDHETRRRTLAAAFNARRGPGAFGWAQPDNPGRTTELIYASGNASPTDGHQGVLYRSYYQIVLAGDDPYWYGDPVQLRFAAPAGQPFLPGPPFFISESTTLGTQTINIDGDVDVFPEWTITGPATTAVLANLDTGKTLDLTPGLAAGQTLTIRTDPRVLASQKFTDSAGANVWASAAGQFPQLWPLQPGPNEITVTAAGTTAASEILLTYRPRYLTA